MSTEKDDNKLNIANADINTSLINDINKNSSIHSLVFNVRFSSNSSPNIRRSKYFNNLSMNYDSSIDINFAQSNEISNDGLFQSILKNESATSDNSFQLNKFNLNDNTSNIIANNPEPELNLIKFNPSQKNIIYDKNNNNINRTNMKGDNQVKVMEKILLNKELNLIKKEKELNKKEKDIHARTEGLSIKEKDIHARTEGLSIKEKDVATRDKELSIKEKDVATRAKELSIKEKDVATRAKELSIKEKDVATKAKELSIKEKDIVTRAKELNHLITELTELKDQPKIVMEKIKKLKLIDVENEDEKENLSQKATFTKNNFDVKKEKQEIEVENNGDINKKKEKSDIFVDNDYPTTNNDEIKANPIHHGDNQRNNGEKDDVEN